MLTGVTNMPKKPELFFNYETGEVEYIDPSGYNLTKDELDLVVEVSDNISDDEQKTDDSEDDTRIRRGFLINISPNDDKQ